MATCRNLILGALLLAGAGIAAPVRAAPVAAAPMPAVTMPAGVTPVQYYYPPPRRRRVCWTEYRRVYVGYDRYGRRVYRNVPRRVCGWR